MSKMLRHVSQGRFTVAPQFAELFDWVELERMVFVPVDEFISGTHEALRSSVEEA